MSSNHKKRKGYSACGYPYYHTRGEAEVNSANLEKFFRRTAFYPRTKPLKNIFWSVFYDAISICHHKIYTYYFAHFNYEFNVRCYDRNVFHQLFYSKLIEALLDINYRILAREVNLSPWDKFPHIDDKVNNLIRICVPTEKAHYDTILPIKNRINKQLFFDYSVFLNSLIANKLQWDVKK